MRSSACPTNSGEVYCAFLSVNFASSGKPRRCRKSRNDANFTNAMSSLAILHNKRSRLFPKTATTLTNKLFGTTAPLHRSCSCLAMRPAEAELAEELHPKDLQQDLSQLLSCAIRRVA